MKNKIVLIGFLIVILLGVFFCFTKEGFNEDELVTYGLSNSHNNAWIQNVKDKDDRDMAGEVLTGKEVKSYLTVDPGERFDFASTYMNQTKDVHPPLHYLVINLCSSFKIGSFSKWIGLIPNIIFWILTLVLVYLSILKLTSNKIASLVGMLSYGLCTGGISSMLFIRMYMLLALFSTLFIYLFIRLRKQPSKLTYVFIGATVFGGMMTQYEFLYFALSFALVYGINSLFKKRFKELIKMAISIITGFAAFICAFPFFFEQIKNGANEGAVSGGSLLDNLLTISGWPKKIALGMYVFSQEDSIVLIGLIIVMVVLIVNLIKKRKTGQENSVGVGIICGTLLVFTILITLLNPDITRRYYYNELPVLSIVFGYGVYYIIDYLKNKKSWDSAKQTKAYVVVIAVLVVCSAAVLIINQPDYIYKGTNDQVKTVKKYGKNPTIYIASGDLKQVHDETLQYLVYCKDCLIVDPGKNNTGLIKSYLNKYKKADKVMEYFDVDSTTLPEDAIINDIQKQCGLSNYKKLFSSQRTNVALMDKEKTK